MPGSTNGDARKNAGRRMGEGGMVDGQVDMGYSCQV